MATLFGAPQTLEDRIAQAAGGKPSIAQRIAQATGAASTIPEEPITLGQKALGVVKGAGKFLLGTAVTGATAAALADSFNEDSTARYAKRFGVDEPTGSGSAGDIMKFAALRAGGFASDLGNELTRGYAGKFYRDEPLPYGAGASAAPAAVPATATATAPAAAPAAPAPIVPTGQQQIRVERQPNGVTSFTGAGAPVDAAAGTSAGVQYTGPAAATLRGGGFNVMPAANLIALDPQQSSDLRAARQAAADRGDFNAVAASYGGDFGNKANPEEELRKTLANMPINTVGDLNRYNAIAGALGASAGRSQAGQAEMHRANTAAYQADAHRAQAAFDSAMKVADLRIKQQQANTSEREATGKGTVMAIDKLGNPLIVNKQTGKAKQPEVTPTLEAFSALVQANPKNAEQNLTPQELQAAYLKKYYQ